jgi:hypothetical protein
MAAAAIEPISPELVLVCPELREQAIDEAPSVRQPPRDAPVDAEPRRLPSALAAALLLPLVPIVLTGAFVLFVTTVLTIVSDAVR